MKHDLQQIADKAAEAALAVGVAGNTLALACKIYPKYWDKEAPARLAFAQSVMEQIKEAKSGDSSRDAFEDCFPNLGKEQTQSGMYADRTTQCVWEGWQAAIKYALTPLPAQESATPQPPKDYHYATEEERKCLPVGSKCWEIGYLMWCDSRNANRVASSDCIYACPDHPPLVTFDASGKLLPPPFGEWHRSDGWTPEMLEGGWRPLMLGEKPQPKGGDQVNFGRAWEEAQESTGATKTMCQLRTRRPLPAPPKKPEWVPLGPEDVPPGSVFRNEHWKKGIYITPSLVGAERVTWTRCDYSATALPESLAFKSLMDQWLILRPGQDWQPCRKLKA